MQGTWERFLDPLRADNTSGAAELATRAAMAILEWIDETGSMPPHAWEEAILAWAPRVYQAQPAMAPLFNLVNGILLALESATVPEGLRPLVRRVVGAFLERLAHGQEAMTAAALRLIRPGARILTYSCSSSVLAVLLAAGASQRVATVFCTESRPILEGQRLARELALAGIAVELGIDAALAVFAEQTDMALVGADSLTTGGVVNKLGTTSLALACRHTGIPCYVVAGGLKWIPAAMGAPTLGGLKPTVEVWSNPPSGVTIRNTYFECTPLTLFSGVIGDNGLQGPEDVLRELQELPIAQILRAGTSGMD